MRDVLRVEHVGIRDAFRLAQAAAAISPVVNRPAARVGIRSPWSSAQLQAVTLADIFGENAMPITRAQAMQVPSIAKARHLICSPLARQPLVARRSGVALSSQPTWLYRTNTQTHPNIRMLWTLDDLLFGGWSLWAVERSTTGQIIDAVRVPPEWWSFGVDGAIEVNGAGVDADSVILFSGPFEGLLEAAAPTIRAARSIERAWFARAESPIPAIELHQTTDDVLDDDEIDDLIESWATARLDPHGAIAYTPFNIQAIAHGQSDPQMFIEGRNAIRLDIANFTGLPASMLDGSMATASLTYSTETGKRNEFIDYSVGMWQDPIEARLSMDDVVPRGTSVAFDLTNLIQLPQSGTGPTRED